MPAVRIANKSNVTARSLFLLCRINLLFSEDIVRRLAEGCSFIENNEKETVVACSHVAPY